MKSSADACGCFPTGRHYPGIAHLVRIQSTGLVEAFAPDQPWIDVPIALIDLETTGRDAQADRVVEIGVVVGRRGEIVARHEWLVNPGRPIPEEAKNVHGISDEMVADKPPFADVVKELAAALDGVVPAAYNASFDKGFVMAELRRAGIEDDGVPPALRTSTDWIDPFVWAMELHKFQKGKTLKDVSGRLGISLEGAHRATNDAEAALRVLYAFGKDAVRVPKSYAGLVQEQKRLSRQQDEERARWRASKSTT